jgi:hypothetical protein
MEIHSRDFPLQVSWELLVAEFSQRYDKIFGSSSSRIHLDISNDVVEGAKGKWSYVALFDCVLCFILGKDQNMNRELARRRFNQYAALRESVCIAVSASWIARVAQNISQFVPIEIEFPQNIQLVDVREPWDKSDHLFQFLMVNAPKKTIGKRAKILKTCFSLKVFQQKSLNEILSQGVSIIYRQVRFLVLNSKHILIY